MRALHPAAQRVAGVAAHLVVLVFSAAVLGWGGWELVSQRWAAGQLLPALGISKAWFYLAIPVSGALMSLFSLELVWLAARGPLPADGEKSEPA